MSIKISGVGKRFGDFVALCRHRPGHPHRRADRAARPQRRRQVDPAADHRRPRALRHRHRRDRGQRRDPAARPEAQRRLRLPALRRVPAHERGRERGLRAEDPEAAQEGDRRQGRRAAAPGAPVPVRRPAARPSCPAASGSGWPWPGPWPSSRRCCCSTSRSAPWTPRSARSCATWLRRLHDEVHVTTVFVTHDQEEALEVADQIVVINDGRDRAGRQPRRPLRRAGARSS